MNAKTRQVLNIFQQISAIPRCSKQEGKISHWLTQWAEANGYAADSDGAGNLNIEVPATPGYESGPPVVIQGHMDMVCEKTPDSNHDFRADPISLVYEGDWLKAHQTSLGADNGIGLALALALVQDETVHHPPLELLFTVDEESGLTGANKLAAGFVRGKILLNLDSEAEGVFTVGCAGGQDLRLTLAVERKSLPKSHATYQLSVQGLRGGHSGVDIHKQRANAICILARALRHMQRAAVIRIVALEGGSAHNAIPRQASSVLACDPGKLPRLQQLISDFEKSVKDEYATIEPQLALTLIPHKRPADERPGLSRPSTARVIDLLAALPHGVARMSATIEGLVETSNNLATLALKKNTLAITTSQRSSIMSRLQEISDRIEAVAALAGAKTKLENGYPAWEPDLESALLQRCQTIYQELSGKPPVVEIIHAGLECGIIGAKYGGMEMISLGPTLENPHSPDERLYIPSLAGVWDFLAALLKSFRSA